MDFIEDGAEIDQERVEGEQNHAGHAGGNGERPPTRVNWTWIAAAGVAAVAVTGGIVIYCLYKRIQRLENVPNVGAPGRLARNISGIASKIDGIDTRLVAVERAVKSASSNEVSATLNRHSKELSNITKELNLLSSRQSNIEQTVEATMRDVAARVSAVHEKLLNTQRFIVEMAQRQKWPWPFNNRIQGLEKEFGLPKSK